MSRFVDSPLLEDDGEDLPEVPSRLEDYDDDAITLNSTNAHFEAKYPEVASHAASKNSSRNSTYGASTIGGAGKLMIDDSKAPILKMSSWNLLKFVRLNPALTDL